MKGGAQELEKNNLYSWHPQAYPSAMKESSSKFDDKLDAVKEWKKSRKALTTATLVASTQPL